MRATLAAGALLGALAAGPSSAPVAGTPPPTVFALKSEAVKSPDEPVVALAQQWAATGWRGGAQPAPRLPKDVVAGAVPFSASVGGRQTDFLVLPSRPPRLYVDTDGDRDFSDETAIVGQAEVEQRFGPAGRLRFGPVTLGPRAGGTAGAVTFAVDVIGGYYVQVYPAVVRAGTIEVAGATYAAALADGNLDGRCDGFATTPPGGSRTPESDSLAIDQDRDGKFDGEREVLPLGKVIRVGGAYYAVEVAADGATLRLTPAALPTGTLDVGSGDVETLVWSGQGSYLLTGSDGRWALPAGTYTTVGLRLRRVDEKGTVWQVSAKGAGKLERFEIREGATQTLKAGPPLVASTDAQETGSGVLSIGLTVRGQGGEEYLPGVEKNGQGPEPPAFKIVSEAGKVLVSDSFAFG